MGGVIDFPKVVGFVITVMQEINFSSCPAYAMGVVARADHLALENKKIKKTNLIILT